MSRLMNRLTLLSLFLLLAAPPAMTAQREVPSEPAPATGRSTTTRGVESTPPSAPTEPGRMLRTPQAGPGRMLGTPQIAPGATSRSRRPVDAAAIERMKQRYNASARGRGPDTTARLRELNAKLASDEALASAAGDKKIEAELARRRAAARGPAPSARLDSIRLEALAIQNRQATASAEQKAKDAARINALYAEYQRLAR